MEQQPKGIPEEIAGEAREEAKEDPTIEVLPEEFRPVVDRSELEHPAHPARRTRRRAWSYWTS